MQIKLGKIKEKDMDLLIVNLLIKNRNFLHLFYQNLNNINFINDYEYEAKRKKIITIINNYKIKQIIRSLHDKELGESDIVLILENKNENFGFLIENKITAVETENQHARYIKRGNKLKEVGVFDDFIECIIAPKRYIATNNEASKYTIQITYEDLVSMLDEDLYAKSMISQAIEQQLMVKSFNYIKNKDIDNVLEEFIEIKQEVEAILGDIKSKQIIGSNFSYIEFYLCNDNKVTLNYDFNSQKPYLKLSNLGKHLDFIKKNNNDSELVFLKKGASLIIKTSSADGYNTSFEIKKLVSVLNLLNLESLYLLSSKNNGSLTTIKSIENLKQIYFNKKLIIVNYDKGFAFRTSKETSEFFAGVVDYPYVQQYQTGLNPSSILLMVKNNELYQLKRVEPNNELSKYYKEPLKENISSSFFEDPLFGKTTIKATIAKPQHLLEIID